jgi:hypothetical protein
MPFCFLAEVERDGFVVFGQLDRFAQQAVHREGLVRRLIHQRVVSQALAEEEQACGGRALDDERVQRVERADGMQAQRAAFRCVRVRVIHVREFGTVFRRAVHGKRVHGRNGFLRLGGQRQKSEQGGD